MFALTDTKKLSTQGAWVHIKNAETGKPAYAVDADGKPNEKKPVRIKVVGPDSPDVQLRNSRRTAKLISERGGSLDMETMSEDDIFDLLETGTGNRIDDAVAATIDWENMPGSDGKDVPFNVINARKLYEAYPAVLREVEAVFGDMAAFIKVARKA